METENPRAGSTGASVSIAADTETPTRNRPKLQASPEARLHLSALLWAEKLGARHG